MKLYNSLAAPNPKRVRVFLAEKGLEIPTVNIDFEKDEQRAPDFLKINSLGLVPALVLDDGTVLTESVAICRYLDELHPDPPLFGTDAPSRAQVEMWNRRMEMEVFRHCGDVAQHTFQFFADKITQVPAYAEAQRTKAAERFRWLDGEIAGRDYIAGAQFTMADIIGITAYNLAKMIEIEIGDDLDNLNGWFERVSARPSFNA